MEKKELIASIEKEAKDSGISEKRLSADISATYLPESGTFTGWRIANPNQPTAHIRVVADDGSSISIGSLRALAFYGKIEDAKFRKVEDPASALNGGFVLTGVQAVNPNIGGKMATAVANLIGRKFTAKAVDLITVSPKSENGKILPYTTVADAKKALITKRFYEVKFVE